MKQLSLILLLLFSATCWGADFQKGIDAYMRGDYATALKEMTPLAEQGNARAQHNLGWMYGNGEGVPQDFVRAHIGKESKPSPPEPPITRPFTPAKPLQCFQARTTQAHPALSMSQTTTSQHNNNAGKLLRSRSDLCTQ